MPTHFIVPQFIEEESRILGKITVRQFIILTITFVFEFIIFRIASVWFFLLSLVLFAGPAIVLALVKVNGLNFHIFLLNFLQGLRKPSLRIWNKEIDLEELKFEMERNKLSVLKPKEVIPKKQKPTTSRLAELSLIVDTGGMYKGET